jgi:N utilization substance protein B
MLFAFDMSGGDAQSVTTNYWKELGDDAIDQKTRDFADSLVNGTLVQIESLDNVIRTRAEHWRIERMAIVDRNVLRLAVFEFLHQDTPDTVAINEALEIARRFSTYEATQFINGILDAIRLDIQSEKNSASDAGKSQASSI